MTETRKPPSGEGEAAISPPCAEAMLRQDVLEADDRQLRGEDGVAQSHAL